MPHHEPPGVGADEIAEPARMNASAPAERLPVSPFWTFSLRLYGKADVPAACITLQEKSGVDVNVLLFCLFAAKSGRALGVADVARIISAIDPWKAGAVIPLRAARMFLRTPPSMVDADGAAALRQRVKAIELEAERLQQEGLFKSFPAASLGATAPSDAAARTNVQALADCLKSEFDRDALGAILAAFDTIGRDSWGNEP